MILIDTLKNRKLTIALTITAFISFTSACSVTPKLTPIENDDKQVTLIVDKNYILNHSSYDYYPGQFFSNPDKMDVGGGGVNGGLGALVVMGFVGFVEVSLFAVYTPLKLIGNAIQGIYITIQPVGYDQRYTQEIRYGKNRVWLPNGFLQKGGQISFTVLGGRQGMWMENYIPSEKLNGITILSPEIIQTSHVAE